jgi:AcrR family transcriptional regulator
MNIITPEPEPQGPLAQARGGDERAPAAQARGGGEAGPTAQARGGRETRQRLVESALEVFAERGYHAATLSEIAARAGLTTGAVYSTFGSKKALLIAACTQGAADEDEVEAVATHAGSLRDALETLVIERARAGLSPATLRLLKLQVEVLKLGLREPEVLEAMSASGRQQLAALSRGMEALARRDGIQLSMPAGELAVLLSAMLNGLALVQLADPALVPESVFLRGLHALMGWEQPAGR